MEADWEVEIGSGAPIIDALWEGLIDLRRQPERVSELAEVRELSALGEALAVLNANTSSMWTAKCDVWIPEKFDPDELDARNDAESNFAMACYIDLLPRDPEQWSSPELLAAECRLICARLHEIPLRACRADLIVRRACVSSDCHELGITAYLTAFAAALPEARGRLGLALGYFVQAVLQLQHPANPTAKLQ